MKGQRSDVTEVLTYLLMHWRGLLLWSFAAAVLLSGWKSVRLYRQMRDPARNAQIREEQESYQHNLENLRTRISEQEALLQEIREYEAQSVLAKLNPYDLCFASVSYHVTPDTNAEGNAVSRIDKILRAYQSALDYGDYADFKRDGKNLEARYVRELVYDLADYTNGNMTLQFLEEDLDSLEYLMEYVKAAIEKMTPEIVSQEGGFQIAITEQIPPGNVVSFSSLLDYGGSALENLATKLGNLSSSKYMYQRDITEYLGQIEELAKPELRTIGRKDLAKCFVTYAVLGAFGGILAGAFVYCCRFASGGKLYSEQQAEGELGVYVLANGCRRSSLPFRKLDAWIRRKAMGEVFDLGSEQGRTSFYDVVAAQCRQLFAASADLSRPFYELAAPPGVDSQAKDQHGSQAENQREEEYQAGSQSSGTKRGSGICLLSSCKVEGAEEAEAMLRERFPDREFWIGVSPGYHAAVLDRLAAAEAVLLLEQKERSSMEGIRQEIRLLERMQKPLAGMVLV